MHVNKIVLILAVLVDQSKQNIIRQTDKSSGEFMDSFTLNSTETGSSEALDKHSPSTTKQTLPEVSNKQFHSLVEKTSSESKEKSSEESTGRSTFNSMETIPPKKSDQHSATSNKESSSQEEGKQFHSSSRKTSSESKDKSFEDNSSEERYNPKYLVNKEEQCRRLSAIEYSALNQVCEDCYSLHNEPEIYTLCRTDCFSSRFLQGCMATLLISEEDQAKLEAYLDNAKSNQYRNLQRRR